MSERALATGTEAFFRGRIGVATVDITPPVGIYARNWGAAKHDVADWIHRKLTLNALVLCETDSQKPVVFLDGDLGWWRSLPTFYRFQSRLLEKLKLDETSLIFGVTHTHASPPLTDPDPDLPASESLAEFLEQVFEASVKVTLQAMKNATEAVVEWKTGRCELAGMRDLPDPDGERLVCGWNPNEPADDTLVVGRISDLEGTLQAVIVNYACHPTTLAWENTAISPDYPGAMRETILKTLGVPALFMQGTSGELAPRYQYVGDPAVADRHGRQLAYATLATLENMEPPGTCLEYQGVMESGAPLAVWKHKMVTPVSLLKRKKVTVTLPIKDWPTAEELEQQRQACTDRALEERLRRRRNIRRGIGDGSTLELPIWVWRMGDTILVGSPTEAYSILQRTLRERFPERTIVCLNLINGTTGYLTPEELYDLDLYQVWQTPFARGSLEKLISGMTEAIQEIIQD
ncbi:Neutral/alkaline non-lysosomal ceramidase [Gimesia panareensis]|uniref:Neutral/alkaline non-lysosomal ceramidase n=1 Tax=Gimesia panareensis TaxID=2527978 RepID=A0A518FKK9_9PLAN|nr:alkaline ceramidase [Gimesia panareensis]QDV16869.1 Neutral/alkaline non-lysosomal ceramidase [Gimesia panareensis]